MEQIGIYDEKILEPYNNKLKQLQNIINEDEQNCALPEPILELVRYNYAVCSKFYICSSEFCKKEWYVTIILCVERIYDELLSTIKDMSPAL